MHYAIVSWELGPVAYKPRGASELSAVAYCLESQTASVLHAIRSLGKLIISNICCQVYAIWRFHIFISISINRKVEEQSFKISPVLT